MQTINPNASIVPLGEMVADVLTQLTLAGHITHGLPRFEDQVVSPPHLSGANAESIT
jgi:hypothetical protein